MRLWHFLILAVVGSLALVMSLPPIPQPLSYHNFADTRSFFGIPNVLNVATNLPFLAVGLAGLMVARKCQRPARWAWGTLFLGGSLVAFGSSYYHWSPTNDTLVWDRLPMAAGFMGLLVALVTEYVHPKFERYCLTPAVLLGLSSVVYWHFTDDLRFYAWVQFFPFCVVLILLAVIRGRDRSFLFTVIALYAAAKIAEFYDAAFFALTREIFSGHSLKHLFAAGGLYAVYEMIRPRSAASAQSSENLPKVE